MAGYWNDEAATEAAMEDDWFRTGDLGHFDEADFLVVEGRKKNVAVLDTGRNVAPADVEDALTRDRLIGEAMVVADGRKFVTALIQPNFDALVEFAEREGIAIPEDGVERGEEGVVAVPRSVVEDDRVRERYESVVEAANAGLSSYESVGDFRLVERAFSVEREELTPTMKKRRSTIQEHYAGYIESMYAD